MNTSKMSWGRAHNYTHAVKSFEPGKPLPLQSDSGSSDENKSSSYALPYGMGRSYGDSNLNDNGVLLNTIRLKSFLSADWETGLIKVQSGITLDEILQVCVPKGWFLPVTPGSKFVTIGGAIANNVHGKNHHKVGSFGNFVTRFLLHRSDKEKTPLICSAKRHKDLFEQTIGGLGLSGIIEWAELQLKPINSSYLTVENIPYDSLEAFFDLSRQSESWDYTVAWVDCFSKDKKIGRGIFTRANFLQDGALKPHRDAPKLVWPFVTPSFFLNKLTIKIFNWLYRWRPGARYKGTVHYDSFFYPLDGIAHWNRLYGKRGFFQHQSLVPLEGSEAAIRAMLKTIEKSGQGSFLAVLKLHGPETSPGLLSFCREGLSLALDFPNRGEKTRTLLKSLDEIVATHSGRLYPAKDSSMSAQLFQTSYPMWNVIENNRDPHLSSSFWRRVTEKA